MPIFEYVCKDCRSEFELLVHASTEPRCPACQGRELSKQLSVFAVSRGTSAAPAPAPGACGTCGDPRGPGACRLGS